MSTAALLVIPRDNVASKGAYSFDHAMSHRNAMEIMGPLTQWSVMPYFVDPAHYDAQRADAWNLKHQQAHNDALTYLPATAQAVDPGFPTSQILVDTNFEDEASRTWWTFANHYEHFAVGQALAPVNLQQTPLPWWLEPPRVVTVFW